MVGMWGAGNGLGWGSGEGGLELGSTRGGCLAEENEGGSTRKG